VTNIELTYAAEIRRSDTAPPYGKLSGPEALMRLLLSISYGKSAANTRRYSAEANSPLQNQILRTVMRRFGLGKSEFGKRLCALPDSRDSYACAQELCWEAINRYPGARHATA
jgi:hypothetical protein